MTSPRHGIEEPSGYFHVISHRPGGKWGLDDVGINFWFATSLMLMRTFRMCEISAERLAESILNGRHDPRNEWHVPECACDGQPYHEGWFRVISEEQWDDMRKTTA